MRGGLWAAALLGRGVRWDQQMRTVIEGHNSEAWSSLLVFPSSCLPLQAVEQGASPGLLLLAACMNAACMNPGQSG